MKEVIATKNAPGAIGPYSQGIRTNGLVFTSGQLPMDPQTGVLEKTDIKNAARLCLENVKGILEAAGTSLDKAVKVTVFLTDMAVFKDVNEVYATFFGGDCPARSCYQVAGLPAGAMIEIEAIAEM